jgi:hypothetical protein
VSAGVIRAGEVLDLISVGADVIRVGAASRRQEIERHKADCHGTREGAPEELAATPVHGEVTYAAPID